MYNRNFKTGLLLAIDPINGVVAEYKRQIYEASLLGIKSIKYIFLLDQGNESENIYNKIDEIIKLLNETIKKFDLKVCDTILYSFQSKNKVSSVVKVDNLGRLRSCIEGYEDFSTYKKHNKDKLRNRKKLSMALRKEK